MEITIEYKGLKLQVDYDFCEAEGDGWNDEHFPAHVEQINEIKLDNYSLFEALESKLSEIEELVFAAHIDEPI